MIKDISDTNLSLAWGKAFIEIMERRNSDLQPLSISITNINKNGLSEIDDIAKELNKILKDKQIPMINETSDTIFPKILWNLNQTLSIEEFSELYLTKHLPRFVNRLKKRRKKIKNTYFERMINYKGLDRKNKEKTVNQLAFIINHWSRGTRHSPHFALQISIFDPAKDHNGQRQSGFPCLQQISIGYNGDEMSLNAYYPTQYIIDRAYGNYRGLCDLGFFLSKHLELNFATFNCYIARPYLGSSKIKKSDLENLKNLVINHIEKE